MSQLESVLDELSQEETVYLVESADSHEVEFVLGSESVCGSVMGLYDEEYGWPRAVNANAIKDVGEIAPGRRYHPCILRDNKCVAIGISVEEYEEIKKRRGSH